MKNLFLSWWGQCVSGVKNYFSPPLIPSVVPVSVLNYHFPENTSAYVMGDIHGCHDILMENLDLLQEALKRDKNDTKYLIFLGDYIDRGFGSKQVIDMLLHKMSSQIEPIFILGNHEMFLLNFLDHPTEHAPWLEYGGIETLRSYGVAIAKRPFTPESLEEMASTLRHHMPESHLHFLSTLKPCFECGDYFFVHAGIHPHKSFEDQTLFDLTTSRQLFLQHPHPFSKRIVHGHTPQNQIDILPHRINLDTGAYMTGVLGMIRITSHQVDIISPIA